MRSSVYISLYHGLVAVVVYYLEEVIFILNKNKISTRWIDINLPGQFRLSCRIRHLVLDWRQPLQTPDDFCPDSGEINPYIYIKRKCNWRTLSTQKIFDKDVHLFGVLSAGIGDLSYLLCAARTVAIRSAAFSVLCYLTYSFKYFFFPTYVSHSSVFPWVFLWL